tara:strand:- start:7800 stop:12851 length:5052 start_codon:yes stop_codon:yes gene_type:complete
MPRVDTKLGKNQGLINVGVRLGFDDGAMNKSVKEVERGMKQMAARTAAVSKALSQTQRVATFGVGASLAAAFAFGARAAIVFEEQFANVKKTLDVSGEGAAAERAFKGIAEEIRNISKFTPATVAELTQIAAVGGQLGIAANDIVKFTDTIQKLTVATNLGAEQAALSLARLQKITGLSSGEIDNLASVLVKLGNNFATTESEIITAATQIATATAGTQTEFNNAAVDALAFATALRAIGQPAQAGSTAIIRLVQVVDRLVSVGGPDLALVAKTADLSVEAFKNLSQISPNEALALFISGLGDVEKNGNDAIAILEELGLGQIRTRRAVMALARAEGEFGGKTVPLLTEALAMANDEFVENQALLTEAERRYETVSSQIQIFKNIINEAGIALGVEFLPQINNVVQGLINIASGGSELDRTFGKIVQTIVGIGVAFGVFVGTNRAMKVFRTDTELAAQQMARLGLNLRQAAQAQTALVTAQRGRALDITSSFGVESKPPPTGIFMPGAAGRFAGGIRERMRGGPQDPTLAAAMGMMSTGQAAQLTAARFSVFTPAARETAKTLKQMASINARATATFIAQSGVLSKNLINIENIDAAMKKFNATTGSSIGVTGRMQGMFVGLNQTISTLTRSVIMLTRRFAVFFIGFAAINEVMKFFARIGARGRALDEFSAGLEGIVESTLDVEKAEKRLESLKEAYQELLGDGADAKTLEAVELLIEQADRNLAKGTAQIEGTAAKLVETLALSSTQGPLNLNAQLKATATTLNMSLDEFNEIFFRGFSKLITDIDSTNMPTIQDAVLGFIGTDFRDDEINAALQNIETQVGLLNAITQLFPRGTLERGGLGAFNPDLGSEVFTSSADFMKRMRGKSEQEIADEFAKRFRNPSKALSNLDAESPLGQIITGLSKEEQKQLVFILDAFSDTLTTLSGLSIQELTEEEFFSSASVLFSAKTKFLNDQQDAFVKAGLLDFNDQVDAVKDFSGAAQLVSRLTRDNADDAKTSLEGVREELGLSEMAFVGIADQIDKNLKQSLESAMSLFRKFPEEINKSAEQATANLLRNLRLQEGFESSISELSTFAPLLALQLVKEGPASAGVVRDFLDNTMLAAIAESQLLRASGPELQAAARTSIQEALEAGEISEAEIFGRDTADGFIEGIKGKQDELENIMRETVENAIKAAEDAANTGSPSREMIDRVGEPLIDGIISPIDANKLIAAGKMKDFIDEVIATGEASVENFLGTGGGNTLTLISETLLETINRVSDDFRVFSNLTSAKISQVNANKRLIESEQELAAVQRNNATLQDRYANAVKNLTELEITGRAGNITLSEEIDLLRQKISLEGRIDAAAGKKSASQLLQIQRAEENITDLRAMAAKGIINNLELAAAEENLASLKGEDLSEDERQLLILELAQAEKQLNESREQALEIDSELVDARQLVIDLSDEMAKVNHTLELALLGVEDAENNVISADLALKQAYETFNESVRADGGYLSTLREITGSYDFMAGRIDNVLSKEGLIGGALSGLDTALTKLQRFTSEGVPSDGDFYEIPGSTSKSVIPPGGFPFGDIFKDLEDFLQSYNRGFADRIPGMGMGGRVSSYRHGGRGDPMTRALVGEYGPEEVRFVPGNGFLVKPLGTGSSGTMVNNLNVQVTGVPSDPISARKAAVQISKALRKLDKEGSSGTGLRRN